MFVNIRFMYWTDWGDVAKIERMSMDGTMRQVLHDTNLIWPNGITIDYTSQTLFWIDANLDKIESSYVNGSNRILVSSFILHPFSIAFYKDVLYWSDWYFKQIIYASLSSVENVTGLTPSLRLKPMGVQVVAIDSQPISKYSTCAWWMAMAVYGAYYHYLNKSRDIGLSLCLFLIIHCIILHNH